MDEYIENNKQQTAKHIENDIKEAEFKEGVEKKRIEI
jgi:hypothetical protein